MNDKPSDDLPRASHSHLSHSAIGRLTSSAARFIANASKIRATGRYLRRQLWAWPFVAVVLFGGAGWWVHVSVEDAMRVQRVNELNVSVDASVSAVRLWMREQTITAQLFADDEQLRALALELLALEDDTQESDRQLLLAPAQDALRNRLNSRLISCGFIGFFVVSPNGIILSADQDPPIGKKLTGYRKEFFDGVNEGVPAVSRPFRSPLLLLDENGNERAELPTMFAAAPIKDERGNTIATLGLRARPQDQFTRILEVVRAGSSGETYAFDRDGVLLSQSRFDEELKQIGLLPDLPGSHSILNVEIRDPEVNLMNGERPKRSRAEMSLTQAVSNAVQGIDGCNAEGYRGYRGLMKVGAWRWLDDLGFGIVTEADVSEVYHPVYILRSAFRTLMALLLLSAVGLFVAMLFMSSQQRVLQSVTLAAKQLGQYTLVAKIGSGGMGTVYKAQHIMLRRPTAVKLLDIEKKMSPAAIARFEREVQLTSSLSHPNTVSVFDYGRTPDGVFYYAMEYLEGLNLDDLVKRFGPMPEARVVYILKQACGALAEAHAAKLVHRDIKPANLFLTCRGGLSDFVKVLDFGLVKDIATRDEVNLTSENVVTGTPLYLSPEAINQPDNVDARSDVYALASVAYFLLTGTPVFNRSSVTEICMMHLCETPEPPSLRRGQPILPSLEQLILRCLAKSRSDRPNDASELLHLLESIELATKWTAEDASTWWAGHTVSENESVDETALFIDSGKVNRDISSFEIDRTNG